MKKMLVFGGTRFFGQKVVHHFIEQGYEVTIATRGQSSDDLGELVKWVIIDRSAANHPGWSAISEQHWDIVFDNIAYTWEDSQIICDKLSNVAHYLFTSSLAVYEGTAPENGFSETDFDGSKYHYQKMTEVSYADGKRQCEAYLTQNYTGLKTFLRFPVVLDNDDYTERLHYYVRKALANEPINFANNDGRFSFVEASEIPTAIEFIVNNQIAGPINVASNEIYTTDDLLARLISGTELTNLNVTFDETAEISPLAKYDQPLSAAYLTSLGYSSTQLDDWLPQLIRSITIQERS